MAMTCFFVSFLTHKYIYNTLKRLGEEEEEEEKKRKRWKPGFVCYAYNGGVWRVSLACVGVWIFCLCHIYALEMISFLHVILLKQNY